MRRLVLLAAMCAASPAFAGEPAKDISAKIDAISARLGLPPGEPADAHPAAPAASGKPASATDAKSGRGMADAQADKAKRGDPLLPAGKATLPPLDLTPKKPVRHWTPDFRRRDVEYLGQWVPIYVGVGFATPVTFPRPIQSIKILHGDELGLAAKFVPGLSSYNFVARTEAVNTQIIATAKDGHQYLLLARDGNRVDAHGRIDAGGVLLIERRDPPKEGIDLNDLASWEKYGAGTLNTRQRITRLLVAMYKKEPVRGYKVLNFKGKVLASDPIMQIHLIRVWHKPNARNAIDGIEYWIYNKSDNPIALIPQYVKRALGVDGDFAISYPKDSILPHDYMPVLVVQRMTEAKKPLEEVPVDLNLMLEDVRDKYRYKKAMEQGQP